MIEYSSDVLANANIAVNALDGTSPASDEALLVSAYRATQYKNKSRRRGTYDELISTGTIGLIRDRMILPTATQRSLARNCGDKLIAIGDYTGIETRLADLTGNNKPILDGLRAIAKERPSR